MIWICDPDTTRSTSRRPLGLEVLAKSRLALVTTTDTQADRRTLGNRQVKDVAACLRRT